MDIENLIASVSGDSKREPIKEYVSMDIDSIKLSPATCLESTCPPSVSYTSNSTIQPLVQENVTSSHVANAPLSGSCERETTIIATPSTLTTTTTTTPSTGTTIIAAATTNAGMAKSTQNPTIQYIILQPNGGVKGAPVPMASLLHKAMDIDYNHANVSRQIPVAKFQTVLNKTPQTMASFGGLNNTKPNGNVFVLSNNLSAVNHKPEPGREVKQAAGNAPSLANVSAPNFNVQIHVGNNKTELLEYRNTGLPDRNTEVICPNIDRKNPSAGVATITPVYRICVTSSGTTAVTADATQPRISFVKAMAPQFPDAVPVRPITSTTHAPGQMTKEIVIQFISKPDVRDRKPLFHEPGPSAVDNKLPGTGLVYRTPGANNINKSGNVKRPMNAFMVWARDFRSKLAIEYPGANNSEISIRLGQVWQVMTGEQKRPFYEEAERIKAQHKAAFPGWVYRPLPGSRRRTECRPASQPCSIYPEIKTETSFHPGISTSVSVIKVSESGSGLVAGLKPVPTANALNNSLMMAFAENNATTRPQGIATEGQAIGTEGVTKETDTDFRNISSTSNAGPLVVTCEVGASGVVRLSNSGLATSLVGTSNDPEKPAVTSECLPARTVSCDPPSISANLPHGSVVLHTEHQVARTSIDNESSKKPPGFHVNYPVKIHVPIQRHGRPSAMFRPGEIDIKTSHSSEMQQAVSGLKPPSKRGRPASRAGRLADLRRWAIPVDAMAASKTSDEPKKKRVRKAQTKEIHSVAHFPLEIEQSGLSLLSIPPPPHPDITPNPVTNVDKFGDLLLSSAHVSDPYKPFYMGTGIDNFKDDTSDLDVKWWTNLVDGRAPSPEVNLNVLLSSARVSHSNCSNSSHGSDLEIIPVPASATLQRLQQLGTKRSQTSLTNNSIQTRRSYSRTSCKAPPSGKLTSLARARLVSDHDTIEAASGLVALRHHSTEGPDLPLNLALDNKSNYASENCRDQSVRSASPHDLTSVCSSLTMCVDNPISFKAPTVKSAPLPGDYSCVNSQAIDYSNVNAIYGFSNTQNLGENGNRGKSSCTISDTVASQLSEYTFPSLVNGNGTIEIGNNQSDKRGIACHGTYDSLNCNTQDIAPNISTAQANSRMVNSALQESTPFSGTAVRTPPRKFPPSNGDAHTAEQGTSGMDSKYMCSLMHDSNRSNQNNTTSNSVHQCKYSNDVISSERLENQCESLADVDKQTPLAAPNTHSACLPNVNVNNSLRHSSLPTTVMTQSCGALETERHLTGTYESSDIEHDLRLNCSHLSVKPSETCPNYYSQNSIPGELCILNCAEGNVVSGNDSPMSQLSGGNILHHCGRSDNASNSFAENEKFEGNSDKKHERVDQSEEKGMPRVTRSARSCADYLSPPKKRRYFLEGGL